MMIQLMNQTSPNSTTGCRFCNKISPSIANKMMLENTLVKTLHAEKQLKQHTPLTLPAPKTWSDIKGLLLERCIHLRNICEQVLETNNFELYLFGSQINGKSRSGFPDIDIWCKCSKATLEQKYKILRGCDFKLDFSFVNQLGQGSNNIKLFPDSM
ncbi:MAG: hypothetical protein WD512_01775 [Candidatus Paceibacterota bacterium]